MYIIQSILGIATKMFAEEEFKFIIKIPMDGESTLVQACCAHAPSQNENSVGAAALFVIWARNT